MPLFVQRKNAGYVTSWGQFNSRLLAICAMISACTMADEDSAHDTNMESTDEQSSDTQDSTATQSTSQLSNSNIGSNSSGDASADTQSPNTVSGDTSSTGVMSSSTSTESGTSGNDTSDTEDTECLPGPNEVAQRRGWIVHTSGGIFATPEMPAKLPTETIEINEIVWKDASGVWQVRPFVAVSPHCAKATDVAADAFWWRKGTTHTRLNARQWRYEWHHDTLIDARVHLRGSTMVQPFDPGKKDAQGNYASMILNPAVSSQHELLSCPDYGAYWDSIYNSGLAESFGQDDMGLEQLKIMKPTDVIGADGMLGECSLYFGQSIETPSGTWNNYASWIDRRLPVIGLTLPTNEVKLNTAAIESVAKREVVTRWEPAAAFQALRENLDVELELTWSLGSMIALRDSLPNRVGLMLGMLSDQGAVLKSGMNAPSNLETSTVVPMVPANAKTFGSLGVSGMWLAPTPLRVEGSLYQLLVSNDTGWTDWTGVDSFSMPSLGVIKNFRVNEINPIDTRPDLSSTIRVSMATQSMVSNKNSIELRRTTLDPVDGARFRENILVVSPEASFEIPEGLPVRAGGTGVQIRASAYFCSDPLLTVDQCASSTLYLIYSGG